MGFEIGKWMLQKIGRKGGMKLYVGLEIIMVEIIKVMVEWRERKDLEEGENVNLMNLILEMKKEKMEVLVLGEVEKGGFEMFKVLGKRVGYQEEDEEMIIKMIGIGNMMMKIKIGIVRESIQERRKMILL